MKTLLIIFLSVTALSIPALSAEKAHVYGVGKLSIAFEGKKGEIEFEAPAESTVGFEHKARNAKERKQESDALDKARGEMQNVVAFPKELNCRIEMKEGKIDHSQKHSDLEMDFHVQCDKSPAGHELTLDFSKIFPKLKKINVDIVVDQFQKSLVLESKAASVLLK